MSIHDNTTWADITADTWNVELPEWKLPEWVLEPTEWDLSLPEWELPKWHI